MNRVRRQRRFWRCTHALGSLTQVGRWRYRGTRNLGWLVFLVIRTFAFAVVLVELSIDRLATDVQQTRGASLVSGSIVERGLDRLTFDIVHRRRHGDLKFRRSPFAGGLDPLGAEHRFPLQPGFADCGRQIFEFDLATGGDNHGALDRILQLANVPRPVITDQSLDGGLGNPGNEAASSILVVLEKVYYQHMNVFAPFAQRRKVNRKDR